MYGEIVTTPGDLKLWEKASLGGVFHVEHDSTVSATQYIMQIRRETEAFLSMSLRSRKMFTASAEGKPLEVAWMFFVLRMSDAPDESHQLVGYSPLTLKEHSSVQLLLTEGRYLLVPFSPGCKLRPRRVQPSQRVVGTLHVVIVVCGSALFFDVSFILELGIVGRGERLQTLP